MTDEEMPGSRLPSGRHITYQQRMKYCSRATCKACRSGTPSHGPYWYASWREGGRVRSRYLGKQAPPGYALASDRQQTTETALARFHQPPLRIQTLGRLAAWRGAEPIPDRSWNRKKASALLGILVSQPAFRLHREQVSELLWPGVDSDTSDGRLRSTLRQLREIVDTPNTPGSYLCWKGNQLVLEVTGEPDTNALWVDAAVFEQLAVRALAERDVQLCRQAIERYGDAGDYLPEFVYEEWAIRRREQLRDRLIAVLLHGAILLQEDGVWDEAEHYLKRILAMDSAHEGAACALMTLFRVQGRVADALRIYRHLEASLEELGVEPEPETKRLRDHLEDAVRTPTAQAVLPPRSAPTGFTNLPPPLSSFVGREQEQATVRSLLQTTRLVTLTGIGGVGKTRLALAVAPAIVSDYQDGVWLVDLAALPTGTTSRTVLLCQSIARALGILENVGEPLLHTLTEFLRPRVVLLVIDNCEHLIHECTELIHTLLSSCPRLRVLATSREVLDINGEAAWSVPPLRVPDASNVQIEDVLQSEAAQLFMARAQIKRPDFTVTPANAPTVAQICRKLDGIPLSLELAAARLTMLTVEQIAARLDDRLRLLTGGSRTALPRHQTLRAALHWSYALLDEPERVLLRRLSVFAGGCDLDAIEAICTGSGLVTELVIDVVGSLVNKSLLLAVPREERARYRLLDTVRQYGQEHLTAWGEEEAIRERHCQWYVTVAEQARPQLRGTDQLLWLNRLEAEHDNIRAALEWSIGHPGAGEYGLRLAGAIWQFWYMRNYETEGRSWLQRVLANSDSDAADLKAEALNAAGSLAYLQSDYTQATALLEESRQYARRARHRVAEARALVNLATVAHRQGDYKKALSRYEESVPIFRDQHDMPNAASAVYNLGITWLDLGDYEHAQPYLEEGLQLFRAMDFKLGLAKTLTNLASIMRHCGDIERAKMTMEEGMRYLLESGDLSYKGEAVLEMGAIEEARGNYAEALRYFQEALRLAADTLDEPGCREAMEEVAWVTVVAIGEAPLLTGENPSVRQAEASPDSLERRQALEHATRLLAASDRHFTDNGATRHPRQQAHYDTRVGWLRTNLGEDIFAQCWAAGQCLGREAAVDLALDTAM